MGSPPLVMFIDGLSSHKQVRPIRNVKGLMCKACHLELDDTTMTENEHILSFLPQLINHFQQKHLDPLERMGMPLLDWFTNMVFIPEVASISNLQGKSRVDAYKYRHIGEAFPELCLGGSYDALTYTDSATPLPPVHNPAPSPMGHWLTQIIPNERLNGNPREHAWTNTTQTDTVECHIHPAKSSLAQANYTFPFTSTGTGQVW